MERVIGCLCQCATEEMERGREKHRAEEELLHIRQMKSARLHFLGYTFENRDESHPCAGYAHRYVEHFAEFQKNGQGYKSVSLYSVRVIAPIQKQYRINGVDTQNRNIDNLIYNIDKTQYKGYTKGNEADISGTTVGFAENGGQHDGF